MDDLRSPHIVMRDGSVASVRSTIPADIPALREFFRELSPQSRYRRFFSVGQAPDRVIERLADSLDPSRQTTLVAERSVDGVTRVIAAASYAALSGDLAEAAFAVADRFQGKGLGTALLERLAVLAAAAGITRFQATTLTDNAQMLEVFRDSGFEIRSKSTGGVVDVQLSLNASAPSVAAEEARRRTATAASIRPLVEPKGVAIVGASRDTSSLGRRILDALVAAGFKGPVYPVNEHAAKIAGLDVCRSARDLPKGVDLAVICVPASRVLAAVEDCAMAEARSLLVISAGFAETGAEGRRLQTELTNKVRGYGMRMVGPNCMGLLNTSPDVRLNASFSPVFPPAGHLALLSQSGALGIAILKLAVDRGLGLSSFVSVGNKADVSGNDLLEYWDGDDATRVILLYLESFGNPRRFARLARRIGRDKPIVAVKSGRTHAGSRAAGSHTASLAASDVAVDALFHQAGVIRADTIDEMFDIAAYLDLQPLPAGRRVGIITNAGGPGILAADACEAAGLTLAPLSDATRSSLAAHLPGMANCTNPVDMIASAGTQEYAQTIETMMSAAEVDAVIVIFTPIEVGRSEAIRKGIAEGVDRARAAGIRKPVLACLMADDGVQHPLQTATERIPIYAFPENAVRALKNVVGYAEWRAQPPALLWGFDDLHVEDARRVCRAAAGRNDNGWLGHEEVHRVLSDFGLPVAPEALATTADEAVAFAAVMGYPVVAKLSSASAPHKTDINGVRLNLSDEQSVRQAFEEIAASAREHAMTDAGILIQPMIAKGTETMMGITQDPLFGPLIAFGLGGIHVEVLGDVRFRIAPLTDRDVDDLLHGIKGFRLLEGYRGHSAADLDALREALLRLSRLAVEVPEIVELDLNPVIALPPGHGCRIVDARIRVHSST
jgi:acetyl coenzyme A synthetase (ADP forming)-like protein